MAERNNSSNEKCLCSYALYEDLYCFVQELNYNGRMVTADLL
jgi:hypothetical protein